MLAKRLYLEVSGALHFVVKKEFKRRNEDIPMHLIYHLSSIAHSRVKNAIVKFKPESLRQKFVSSTHTTLPRTGGYARRDRIPDGTPRGT